MDHFNLCVSSYSHCIKGYYNRAKLFVSEEKYEEALADYDTIIKIDCTLGNAYLERGYVYEYFFHPETAKSVKEKKEKARAEKNRVATVVAGANVITGAEGNNNDDNDSSISDGDDDDDEEEDDDDNEMTAWMNNSNPKAALEQYKLAHKWDPCNRFVYLFLSTTCYVLNKSVEEGLSWYNKGLATCVKCADVEFLLKKRGDFLALECKDEKRSQQDYLCVKLHFVDTKCHKEMKQRLFSNVTTVTLPRKVSNAIHAPRQKFTDTSIIIISKK